MTSLPDSQSAELAEAESSMRAGSFESAVEILAKIVERGEDPEAVFMLASSYLELGQYDDALRHATAAVKSEPSSAPARDLLAKVNLAQGDYDSALSDYEAVAALLREQTPAPPEQYAIPAHFALRNIEQLDHIVSANRDEQASANAAGEQLRGHPPWPRGGDRRSGWRSAVDTGQPEEHSAFRRPAVLQGSGGKAAAVSES